MKKKKTFKKKKKPSKNQETEIVRVRTPRENEGEMFGVVLQLMGGTQVKVQCHDGEERNCRIPGKLRKRVWLRQGDLIIVKLWDFQPSKADVVWRYLGNQVEWLKRNVTLEGLPI